MFAKVYAKVAKYYLNLFSLVKSRSHKVFTLLTFYFSHADLADSADLIRENLYNCFACSLSLGSWRKKSF